MRDRILLLALIIRPALVLLGLQSTTTILREGWHWLSIPELLVLVIIIIVWPVTRDARHAITKAANRGYPDPTT